MRRDIEAVFVLFNIHCFESRCHPFRITVFATVANFRAPRDRIPGRVGPLNLRSISQRRSPLKFLFPFLRDFGTVV